MIFFMCWVCSVADPDPGSGAFLTPKSGAFLTPKSGIRMGKNSWSGSGTNNPNYLSESLETIFWDKMLESSLRIRDPGWKIRIRDGKNSDQGSEVEKFRIRDRKNSDPGWKIWIRDGKIPDPGVRDKHPGSATLRVFFIFPFLSLQENWRWRTASCPSPALTSPSATCSSAALRTNFTLWRRSWACRPGLRGAEHPPRSSGPGRCSGSHSSGLSRSARNMNKAVSQWIIEVNNLLIMVLN